MGTVVVGGSNRYVQQVSVLLGFEVLITALEDGHVALIELLLVEFGVDREGHVVQSVPVCRDLGDVLVPNLAVLHVVLQLLLVTHQEVLHVERVQLLGLQIVLLSLVSQGLHLADQLLQL